MGCGATIGYVFLFFVVLFFIIAGLGSLGSKTTEWHAPSDDEKRKVLLDQRDKFAESCKNGHTSDCLNEKNLTDLLNAGGINTAP